MINLRKRRIGGPRREIRVSKRKRTGLRALSGNWINDAPVALRNSGRQTEAAAPASDPLMTGSFTSHATAL